MENIWIVQQFYIKRNKGKMKYCKGKFTKERVFSNLICFFVEMNFGYFIPILDEIACRLEQTYILHK